MGLIVHSTRRSNDVIDQDSLLPLLQKLYISCTISEHQLVSVYGEEHVLAVRR